MMIPSRKQYFYIANSNFFVNLTFYKININYLFQITDQTSTPAFR